MEKAQLRQLMDSAISLDQELKERMAEEEDRLAKQSKALDESLPNMSAERRTEFEASYSAKAELARQAIETELARIDDTKDKQLRATERSFQEQKDQIIEAVLERIRGDELG